ncbi:F0F1 ATP synthase subunit delta [Lentibacillus amyloliquefaciens]|uniref:ATP synthase subunit delta n=1 Tax=Lentibacillus amyloliquefaciens TaxID=1472767 RepID=A0A0U4FAR6_9BACI|nr:F0F1 ATP synthase subunit delta [Lentibacillus amyloliquefaciens]ALX49891.1 ATP synthase F0F1 subunit delta [Lentibacillus amyloliquefaciens]
MSEVVASRYAEALFQIGNEKGTLEQLVEESHVLKSVFNENDQIVEFLEHPRVNKDKKSQFLDDVFQSFSDDVLKTLKLLASRHRVTLVPSIIDHFNQMVNDVKEIAEAKVYSVRELSESEKEQLEKSFAKRFNKQAIKLETVVDPSIIGGIKLQIGNTIYDGTISGKLKRIERNMTTAD